MTPPPASAELLAVVRAARALLERLDAHEQFTGAARDALRTALEALDRIA